MKVLVYMSVFVVFNAVKCDSVGISGAIDKLNNQLKYLISSVEASIDPVIASVKADCEQSRFQTQTYGWALLTGAGLDIAADYVGNSRQPQDILTENLVYPYGYYAAYGIGFGAPYLLPTYIGSCSFDCSSRDFSNVVNTYGFRQGVAGLNIGASKMTNFGMDAKQALSCLIQQTGDSQEAAGIDYAIDDMIEAGTQILSLQNKL